MKTIRQSNIELLRILTMCGVIALHYNGGIGNALELVQPDSIQYWLLATIESLFICAVNVFVLITGYFCCTSQRRDPIKVIQLLVQVIVFQVALYLLLGWRNGSISASGLLARLLPSNYFVTLYIVTYLVSPYINIVFQNLSEKQMTRFVLLLFVLFSVLPITTDLIETVLGRTFSGINTVSANGDGHGYTAINFLLMYVIGAYLRLHGLPKLKIWHLLCIIGACTGLILLMSEYNSDIGRSYCNPLVISLAVAVFLLFTRFTFQSPAINHLSKAAFTVFLFHTYPLGKFQVAKAVSESPVYLLGHMALACISIYLMSWILFLVYDLVTKPVWKLLYKILPKKEITNG